MGQLNSKIAVITGASSGIGKAISLALAAEGATAVLASRNRKKLDEVAKLINDAGGTAFVIPTDVTDEEQVLHLFRETTRLFNAVDLLVNNAGTATAMPVDELSLKEWRRVLDLNLTAAFLCSREAFQRMKDRGAGRIISIGSVAAYVPRPATAPYTVSKAGLEALTHALALEGRDHGITACTLHPGNTLSGFWEKNPEVAAQEGVMNPEDVARMAVTIAAMPDDVLVLRTVMLPINMPFLGRG
jgi:NAD(P)-dependent dehydrogenase (short-subunit alcohol dehydrogenase family)